MIASLRLTDFKNFAHERVRMGPFTVIVGANVLRRKRLGGAGDVDPRGLGPAPRPRLRWSQVRAEVSVKERYFDVLARLRGVADGPGGGRKRLGEEASHRIGAIRQKCPEDFDRSPDG